ncbi:TIGR00159 family protein [Sphingobacteriales bacterium CHB3]|nr:TIGR00159 family protein [Sphingobacteriales bacterium CHB3]
MIELFKIGFLSFTLVDLLDVALVSFIFYRLYLVMRGTIAAQIFVGLVLIVAFSFFAQAINLKAMGWILRTLTDIWVIAFIILFQPELRRLLVLVGRNPVIRFFIKTNVDESIDEVVAAVTEMSRKKQGALIVFVRATGIKIHMESGTKMEAIVSRSLILSIFNPKSPLHDGAIVIKDRLIEAARCILPLSYTAEWEGVPLGTRHRAALGISEQADVVVVIVSEETGIVSIAEGGLMTRGLTPAVLRRELKSRLSMEPDRSFGSIMKLVRNSG